jgi:hypothetical protein
LNIDHVLLSYGGGRERDLGGEKTGRGESGGDAVVFADGE